MRIYRGASAWYPGPQLYRIRRGSSVLGGGRAGLGELKFPAIDAAIQKFEGYTPGSLSYQNNNPGNLVYASWEANYGCQPGGAGGFAKCPTLEAGQQIQDALVSTYAGQGLSLADMLAKWSPPTASGNSQQGYSNYVSSVAADTGLDPSLPILPQLSDLTLGLPASTVGYSEDYGVPEAFLGLDFSDPVVVAAGVLLGGLVLWMALA